MGLGEHLEELRSRVIRAAIVVVPVFVGIFYYGTDLLKIVIRPMKDALLAAGQSANLISTGAVETFSSVMMLSAVATLVVCGPWIVYQAWAFVSPGLYLHERRFAYILAPLSSVLSIVAVLFMYYVMMPVLLFFLINYPGGVTMDVRSSPAPSGIVLPVIPVLKADPDQPTAGQFWVNQEVMQLRLALPVPSTSASPATAAAGAPASAEGASTVPPPTALAAEPKVEIYAISLAKSAGIVVQPQVANFVGLFLTMALGFVAAFQVPVIVLLLGWVGILKVATMSRFRKHVIAASAVLGAILTPSPDPFSMLLMSVPLYLLFELGMLLLWLLPVSRIAGDKTEPDAEDDSEKPDNAASTQPPTSAGTAAPSASEPASEPPGGPADGP